jgi:predicted ATPase
MQTTTPVETAEIALPFVGRETELARLKRLHAQRRHVLLLGPAGAGKSALLQQLAQHLPLLICPESARLTEIFSALEQPLGLEAAGLPLVRRKNRLLAALARAGQTVVFDGVGWTTPRLSSFLGGVCERVPVWIATRSEHSWDIGHFWPGLTRFERVAVRPLRLPETRALVEAVIQRGGVPPETAGIVEWLHRRSAGNPGMLRAFLQELAAGRYDLRSPAALRRLELDRRIHEVFPVRAGNASKRGVAER